MFEINEDMCCYVENDKQCENPAPIVVKRPAPEPYSHLTMLMRFCADHYDEFMKQEEENATT